MNIIHKQSVANGAFFFEKNDVIAGEITYVKNGDVLTIEHTIVNPDFEGQGIGKKLVFEVVEFARENNFKIVPLCPFAKAVFDKVASIQDVLAHLSH